MKITTPTREIWDTLSENYPVEISDEEKKLADEIVTFMKDEGIYPTAKIIELGCGSGHLSACLAIQGYDVTLLDFSPVALEKAKQTFAKYSLAGTFIEGNLFNLQSIKDKYDLAWNSGVMEHFDVDALVQAYSSIMSITKNKFLFLVPNTDSISYLLMRYNLQGRGEWLYGQEYLRNNYLSIAKSIGLSGRILGNAALDISRFHFESTYHNHENAKMYGQLIEDGLLPLNESYLTVYSIQKDEQPLETNVLNTSNENNFKEKFFEASALFYNAKKINEELKLTVHQKNTELLTAHNQMQNYDNILSKKEADLLSRTEEYADIKAKYDIACEKNNVYIQEIERLNNDLIKLNQELEQLNNTIAVFNQKSEQSRNTVTVLNQELEKSNNIITKSNQEIVRLNQELKNVSSQTEKEINIVKEKLNEKQHELDKMKELIFENERELRNKQNELNRSLELLKSEQQLSTYYAEHLKNIIDIIYPQILANANKISTYINTKSFAFLTRIHAIGIHWRSTSVLGKLKLLIKLLLRVFGSKRRLYYDHESTHYNITNSLIDIRNLASMLKIELADPNEDIAQKDEAEISINREPNREEILVSRLPLVSVLLPVFNHASFIQAAIEGVQKQTYNNWELIIINDGSTDDLLEKLEEYSSDPRIKIYTQDNQRLPNTLTNLHGLATGEFITWTSADNIMEPDMLAELSQNLLDHPSASMVFADVSIIDDKGNFVSTGYREHNRDKFYPHIMRLPHCTKALDAECDNFINACFMYRGEYARALAGQYAADLEGLEDYDFWLRLKAFGDIYHIKNTKPLYRYRVHENTMSEDLLKNKREQHIRRSQKLMEYSRMRNEFITHSWKIHFDDDFEYKNSIIAIANSFQYDFSTAHGKNVYFHNNANFFKQQDNSLHVVTTSQYYEVYWQKSPSNKEMRSKVYRGIDIPVEAKKVRQTYINGLYWEYPVEFVNMQVIGCHINFNTIDVERTIEFINANTNILFSFCATPGGYNKSVAKHIISRCDNVIFMEERAVGTPTYLYASWDMMFIPPLKENSNIDILKNASLAWSIGRWMLVEYQNTTECATLPLVCNYISSEKILGVKKVENISQLEEILDMYINKYSIQGCLKELFRRLNGIGQDIFVQRPDFELQVKERKYPPARLFQDELTATSLANGYIAIMVDTLDKGGLEQVVALVVQELIKRGITVKVLCTEKGGIIAEQLMHKNVDVKIFDGNRDEFYKYISANRPLLVNTHYTKKMLDIVHAQNIPIIEVIHNMYVFFDENDWKNEWLRAKYFTKMIAVSELVKEVYIIKNPHIEEEKILVIGNAADTQKTYGMSREYTRNLLGISSSSIVFINVSSVDGRKNQLGLLSAFDYYYRTYNKDSYLILVGNVLSDYYDEQINQYLPELTCKDHVLKLPYYSAIADLYYASDVFVMPSYFEGWSIAATEALYCGLPIIHSRCGSAIELVDSGNNGIIISNPAGDIAHCSYQELSEKMGCRVPENTDELICAMKNICCDINSWREKRSLKASKALSMYSVQNMIDGYVSCFDEIIQTVE